jgi:hypothetical protein
MKNLRAWTAKLVLLFVRAYITMLGEQTVRSISPDTALCIDALRSRSILGVASFSCLAACCPVFRPVGGSASPHFLPGNWHVDPGEKFVLALAKLGCTVRRILAVTVEKEVFLSPLRLLLHLHHRLSRPLHPAPAHTVRSFRWSTHAQREKMTSSLSRIVLMVRGEAGLIRAVNFYQLIGLTPERVTDTWAELLPAAPPAGPSSDGDPHAPSYSTTTRIHLQATAAGNEAAVSTGYSPLLVFEVGCDMLDATVASCLQAGAHLDGPLQYPAHGKVATMRTPDGHMIGLYEPTR